MVRQIVSLALLLLIGITETAAQSAIYACGHIRRQRTTAFEKLKQSGYTTAILFNVNVEADGTLTTDYDWNNQRPATAGGIICQGGEYVFGTYQPEYISDVKSLLEAPTTINRIEICIGGWGNGSYGNIKRLIDAHGTGSNTNLYRNFKALKEAIPEIVAVNNDQEQDYDVASATAFHKMLAEIGYTTTIAPYTNRNFWKQLVENLNTTPGTCDMVYLQTYGGGAGNNPNDWKVFGDIPMWVGFDCEASADIAAMQQRFENWRQNCGATGGFLWNYNSESRNINQWATAINRIFGEKPKGEIVATFYGDTRFGGYSIELPAGRYTQTELALIGAQSNDLASAKIAEGYRATLYNTNDCSGTGLTITGEQQTFSRGWGSRVRSILIEKIEDGIADVEANGSANPFTATYIPGTETISVAGAAGNGIEVYNAAGTQVAHSDAAGQEISLAGQPAGVYLVTSAGASAKIVKH